MSKKKTNTTKKHGKDIKSKPKEVVPEKRGLIDSSLNNAHMLDHANTAGAMLNSKLDDSSNNNANTRSDGKG